MVVAEPFPTKCYLRSTLLPADGVPLVDGTGGRESKSVPSVGDCTAVPDGCKPSFCCSGALLSPQPWAGRRNVLALRRNRGARELWRPLSRRSSTSPFSSSSTREEDSWTEATVLLLLLPPPPPLVLLPLPSSTVTESPPNRSSVVAIRPYRACCTLPPNRGIGASGSGWLCWAPAARQTAACGSTILSSCSTRLVSFSRSCRAALTDFCIVSTSLARRCSVSLIDHMWFSCRLRNRSNVASSRTRQMSRISRTTSATMPEV
uniref:Uncharacterized protein n=1 Tax=Anopheles merus TaxID=30066 RepID=A0A182UYL5_ANOME